MSPPRVIQVAVPRPLHTVYDYGVPEELPMPAIGTRLRVPFGRSNTIGICTATEVETAHKRLKNIQQVLDSQPAIPAELMQLAHWMTQYYHHPLGEVLATMLPSAARKGAPFDIDAVDNWRVASAPFAGKRAPAQLACYEYLQSNGPSSGSSLVECGFSRQTLRNLHTKGAIERCEVLTSEQFETPPKANNEQALAIETINQHHGKYACLLLEGVTGSGKTEVYLRTMTIPLAAQQQILVLVPEIALTPQTLRRFQRRFDNVGMLHSNLSDHDRLQTWLKCKAGKTSVLIGTRSAIFTPFKSLGLIIVDEEHDSSYKQQDGLRYSARDVAVIRARAHNVPVVLGSATPSLESLYNVQRKRYQRLHLRKRAGGAQMPTYNIIDMRGQTHTDGITLPLERVIKRHLEAHGQVLLFLNRRGFAPTLLCAACGWQAHCSACDARLTLHRTPPQLSCHHCGLRLQVPKKCEHCDQTSLLPVGMGTQRTESVARQLFNDVPIYRIDRDTTRSSKKLAEQFDKINQGGSCIMVGTQMLAKGHHFPEVTLVAILNADAGFLSPDFRAPERTAQLIVQVAGRSGRAVRPGEVWIQSFQPDNPALVSLIQTGYPGFAAAELEQRIKMGMPPAKPMALIRAESINPQEAINLLNHAKQHFHNIEALGPVPAPLARMSNRSRFQLMLIADTRPQLHRALQRLQIPKIPNTLRWSIDVDPYDSM